MALDHERNLRIGQRGAAPTPGVPILLSAELPEAGYLGQFLYLSDTDEFRIWDGDAWRNLTTGAQTFVTSVTNPEPVAGKVGDTWLNPVSGETKIWTGSTWELYSGVPKKWTGPVETEDIRVNGGLVLSQNNNEMGASSRLKLATGLSSPAATAGMVSYGYYAQAIAEDLSGYRIASMEWINANLLRLGCIANATPYLVSWRYYDGLGQPIQNNTYVMPSYYDTCTSAIVIENVAYYLFRDRYGSWYIKNGSTGYQRNISTYVDTSFGNPILAADSRSGVPYLAWWQQNEEYHYWEAWLLTLGTLGTAYTYQFNPGSTYYHNGYFRTVLRGTFDFGAERYLFKSDSSTLPNVLSLDNYEDWQTTEFFSKIGNGPMCWDGVNLWTVTANTLYRYERVDVASPWIGLTWRNVTDDIVNQETLVGATYKATLPQRQMLKLTPPKPIGGANQVAIYLANTAGAPTRTDLWLNATEDNGEEITLSPMLFSGTSNPPGTSSFPESAPSEISSDAGFQLKGDGSGHWVGGGYEAGDIKMSARSNPSTGWLLCNGSAVSRTGYAALFAAIGTTYGVGDGSTTFNLPNYQGKFPMGSSGTYPLGSSGGAATHTITTSEMPGHTHALHVSTNSIQAGTTGDEIGGSGWYQPNYSYDTTESGGDSPMSILNPYQTLNYFIKY